ncbi:DUF4194 domain-containing protein [Sulfurovum sp. bin170]|uniref:DUF4194 domain-containing protein n=1 Tax=Sulfurovum sp. bin170 TaxID=2695268 RepID=UPI0013DF065D|nr:DUF4194 domain-containing protein [Sulfurovum sp. bin170]NEW60434.1 DUF4194 domain-containing protein [Sulfurovum sp. bin170]
MEINKVTSTVIIKLFNGVLYKNDNPKEWLELEKSFATISDYLKPLGVEVIFDEAEGYAYLQSLELEEDFPKLLRKRTLSYKVSLLLVLLRKRLTQFDMQSDESRAVISKEEIVEMFELFLNESFNEVKQVKEIESLIKKVVDLGFLKKLKSSESYEIKRVLKSFVDAQWLDEFDKRLVEYESK